MSQEVMQFKSKFFVAVVLFFVFVLFAFFFFGMFRMRFVSVVRPSVVAVYSNVVGNEVSPASVLSNGNNVASEVIV